MSVRSWSKEFFDLLALESVYGVQGEQVLHRWQLWMRDAFAWSRVFRVTCRSIRRESAASQFKMSKTFLIVHRVPVPLQNPNLVRPLIGDCSFFCRRPLPRRILSILHVAEAGVLTAPKVRSHSVSSGLVVCLTAALLLPKIW